MSRKHYISFIAACSLHSGESFGDYQPFLRQITVGSIFFKSGEQVLAITPASSSVILTAAVASIIITAPIGALLIDRTYKKLLSK